MATDRYIAYYRVSTQRQGASGLGLEAQQATVTQHLNGLLPIAAFVEVESGRKADRPELQRAIAACRVHKATLIVAKVDRLARSVAFLSALLESGISVAFCDLPQIEGPTGRFMLQQMAAVAELEAGLISQRTKAALQAARERGAQVGNPGNLRNRDIGAQRSAESRARSADRHARDIGHVIADLKREGITSSTSLAWHMNLRGITTPRGGQWSTTQLQRVLRRLDPG